MLELLRGCVSYFQSTWINGTIGASQFTPPVQEVGPLTCQSQSYKRDWAGYELHTHTRARTRVHPHVHTQRRSESVIKCDKQRAEKAPWKHCMSSDITKTMNRLHLCAWVKSKPLCVFLGTCFCVGGHQSPSIYWWGPVINCFPSLWERTTPSKLNGSEGLQDFWSLNLKPSID